MTDVKLPEPAAFTTQIKEGRVIFMARVSLNTQGLVGIFTSDQLRQAVQEAVEAEREKWQALMLRLHNLSDSEMGDGDGARQLAAEALGLAKWSSVPIDAAAIRSGE
jgi:hypothetical protein